MPKNPFINAALAAGYIGLVVLTMSFIMNRTQEGQGDALLLIPVFMLSLLTLSAAVMGYLFVAEPIMLYLDGKKQEAVQYFLKTLGAFAGITVAILASLFFFI